LLAAILQVLNGGGYRSCVDAGVSAALAAVIAEFFYEHI
jgi:hypothetical protein